MKSSNLPILISGAHRSGSTWVGNVISSAKGIAYLHEPFNPIYPSYTSAPIDKWYLHISGNESIRYYDCFKNTLNWKYKPFKRLASVNSFFRAQMLLKYWWIFQKNKGKRMCMKDPIALLSVDWLYKEFDIQPLLLVRHPAAFAYSLKRKNWTFPFKDLLEQEDLMDGLLVEYKNEIQKFTLNEQNIIDQASLIWNILHSVIAHYKIKYPNWYVVKHEDISVNPLQEFSKIFEYFDLDLDAQVKDYILNTTDAKNPKGTKANEELLKRDAKANISYWQHKLSIEEISRIKMLTANVWPQFYDEKSWM